jgi:predicted dehydrogenase
MAIRTSILGCGLIGEKRAAALTDEFELVSAFDVNAARAAALTSRWGGRDTASALEAIEAVGAGGIVIVATTHDHLAQLATAAVEHGCHVLVEKPGARNATEFAMLARLAESRNVVVRVGFNHRFHPSVRRLKQLIEEQSPGLLLTVRGRYGHGGRHGYESEWRADRQRSGGGELLDQGVHLIDLCHYLAGPIELKYAALSTRYWPMEVEDNAFLHVRLLDDADGWLHASWTEWKNLFSLEFSFAQAKYELRGLGGSYGPEELIVSWMGERSRPPDVTSYQWPPGDDSWRLELLDVAAQLDGAVGTGADSQSTETVLRVVDKAYEQ